MHGFGSMLKDYLDYNRISQTDFADRLGISQKHMNEIINGKTNISTDLILAISLLTDIDANLIYYVENKKRIYDELMSKYKSKKEINKFLNSFYVNEMQKKKWIKFRDESSFVQKYMDLLEYLNISDFDNLDEYLNKRYLFKKKDDANNKKIYLWICHCDNMIRDIIVNEYNSGLFNELLSELKEERMKVFNRDSIIKLLNKYGIILYIEDALSGSKIRGCVKVMVNTPVIYMTTYYKEKSSFYFALYHELMHIKRDYNLLKKTTIIENEDEEEIDNMALNEMIPEKVYKEILNNYNNRELIANNNNIPLCFLYTRLAKDGIIEYSSLDYLNNIERIN